MPEWHKPSLPREREGPFNTDYLEQPPPSWQQRQNNTGLEEGRRGDKCFLQTSLPVERKSHILLLAQLGVEKNLLSESNHRMVEVGSHLWRSSPIFLPKRDYLGQISQKNIQILKTSREGDTTATLGSLFPCLTLVQVVHRSFFTLMFLIHIAQQQQHL